VSVPTRAGAGIELLYGAFHANIQKMRSFAWLLTCSSLLACRPEAPPPGGGAVPQESSIASVSHTTAAAPAAPVLRLNRRATSPIHAVDWSPDGKWLATACAGACGDDAKAEAQRVLVFELPSLKLRSELSPNSEDMGDGRVHGVAFNADGSRLAISTHNGVALFRSSDFTRVADIDHFAIYGSFRFSPNGKYLGLSGVYGVVDVVDAVTGKAVLKDRLHDGAGSLSAGLAWTKDSNTLIVDGNANFGTWTPGAKKITAIGQGDSGTGWFELSSDEKWLLLGEAESCVSGVYSMATRKLAHKVTTGAKPGTRVPPDSCRSGFSPNGVWVAAIDADAAVRLWQAGSAAKPVVVRPPAPIDGAEPVTLAFSPDGQRLLYAIGDVTGIWDIATQRTADSKAPPGPLPRVEWLTPTVIALQEGEETVYFDLARQERTKRPAEAPEGSLDPSGKVRAVADGDLRLRRADGVELWLRTVLDGDKRTVVMVDSRGRVGGDEVLAASDVYDANGGAKLVPRVEAKVAERFFAGE